MRALFARGAFTAGDAQAAAMTLAAYATGLLPFVLMRSFIAPFHARGDTATPVKAAMIAVAVNILLKIALVGSLAQVGLALATAAGAWINLALLIQFARRAGFESPGVALDRVGKLIVAGLILAAALYLGEQLLRPLVAGIPVLREEILLLILLVAGGFLYAALVMGLLGRDWLRQLAKDRGASPARPEPPVVD
jgi:putative peptidoglycan lipid II flippase